VDDAPRNIVEKSFWETEYYWATATVPCRVDMALAFDCSLARALSAHAPAEPRQTVLEVGCAPGKWMIFYAERFGACVSGIEYSEKGAELSRRNLAAAGVDGQILQEDFFTIEPRTHDLVISIGFAEHFDDLAATLARHLKFVAPGGTLVVGVPNFRGFNRAVQWLAEPDYLALHNLAAMRPMLYHDFARRHGLELEHLGHLGGLDPAIIRLSRDSPISLRRIVPGVVTFAESRLRSLGIGERLEHPLLSSYLLAVYRVP
jgi:SAM-dependent methyltransferase